MEPSPRRSVFQSRTGHPLPKNYDRSTKEWEVQSAHYVFDLETRQRIHGWQIFWDHHAYYASEEQAIQAVFDLRRNFYTCYDMREYIPTNPHQNRIPPTRTLNRYKVVKRTL